MSNKIVDYRKNIFILLISFTKQNILLTYSYNMRFNIKHLLAIIILIFSFSCQNEEFQNLNGQANYKEAVWEYNGDSKVIKNVITEMRNVSDIGVFEKNIGQKDLVWEKPKFLVVNKDRKILIPLLNRNKNRVVGVLSLYKDKGNKTNYNLTMRCALGYIRMTKKLFHSGQKASGKVTF